MFACMTFHSEWLQLHSMSGTPSKQDLHAIGDPAGGSQFQLVGLLAGKQRA